MTEQIGNRKIEIACFLAIIILTIITWVNPELIPIHLNITVFSMAIIIIGSYRSLQEVIVDMKKVHIDGKKEESNIETVTSKDAMQFPLVAGGILCGLYLLIKVFGKESVNYFILVYIAIGGTTGIKALL
jgi:minor histocompatibility antigen H13